MDDPKSGRPGYDNYISMDVSRGPLAAQFAEQILETTRPYRHLADKELDVLDIGSGYGHTALELARRCGTVTAMEPSPTLAAIAAELAHNSGLDNLTTIHCGIESLEEYEAFDLIVLDNVYEHLPDHRGSLQRIERALRPGGTLFLLAPNRFWPIEAHYRLPFLSYLPIPWANRYLRLTRRGYDYTDASYAPTLRSLSKDFEAAPALNWRCSLPALPDATMSGRAPVHYRVGMKLLDLFPRLWALSKALLVVAKKDS